MMREGLWSWRVCVFRGVASVLSRYNGYWMHFFVRGVIGLFSYGSFLGASDP